MAVPRNIRGSASQLFYQDDKSPQYHALMAITGLPHPDRSILGAFLTDAWDPQEAARYFLRQTEAHGASQPLPTSPIWEFLSDWEAVVNMFRPAVAVNLSVETKRLVYERDGGRCCLTGAPFESLEDADLRYAHILQPRAFMGLERVENGRLSSILNAFLSHDSVNTLRSTLSSDSQPLERLGNLWLLSAPAFELVKAGEVWFHFRDWDMHSAGKQSYIINTNRYRPRSEMPIALSARSILLEDRTTNRTPIPRKDLLDIHAQFAKSLAWMEARRYMKEGRELPSRQRGRFSLPVEPLGRALRRIWLTVPRCVRAMVYEKLHLTGSYLYGRSLSPRVQRLPFGLYLRKGTPRMAAQYRAEAHTLGIVEKFTRIPAPRSIDVLETPNTCYLLMTLVPGRPIGQLLNTMTDEQVNGVVADLKRYVAELRAIPNQISKFRICNSTGGGVLDWRIPESRSEELRFQTEADFHSYLTSTMTEDTRRQAAKSHAIPHEIVFTHGDLNPRNILGENGKVTGIVDWENAGFFPEYWEYTKMHYTVRSLIRWLADVVDRVFEGYREELHVENMLSDLSGPF